MTIYILCIRPPYKHARHYIGYTTLKVKERVDRHLAGQGSPLIRAAVAAGCSIEIAVVVHKGTRTMERKLKNYKRSQRFCPLCGGKAPKYRRIKDD